MTLAHVRRKQHGTAMRSKGLLCLTQSFICLVLKAVIIPHTPGKMRSDKVSRVICYRVMAKCSYLLGGGGGGTEGRGGQVMQLMSINVYPLMHACRHISSYKTSLIITVCMPFCATQSCVSASLVCRSLSLSLSLSLSFSLPLLLLLPPAISLTSKPHEFFDYIY